MKLLLISIFLLGFYFFSIDCFAKGASASLHASNKARPSHTEKSKDNGHPAAPASDMERSIASGLPD